MTSHRCRCYWYHSGQTEEKLSLINTLASLADSSQASHLSIALSFSTFMACIFFLMASILMEFLTYLFCYYTLNTLKWMIIFQNKTILNCMYFPRYLTLLGAILRAINPARLFVHHRLESPAGTRNRLKSRNFRFYPWSKFYKLLQITRLMSHKFSLLILIVFPQKIDCLLVSGIQDRISKVGN